MIDNNFYSHKINEIGENNLYFSFKTTLGNNTHFVTEAQKILLKRSLIESVSLKSYRTFSIDHLNILLFLKMKMSYYLSFNCLINTIYILSF